METLAMPSEIATVPNAFAPSMNVTIPVGVPAAALTVPVNYSCLVIDCNRPPGSETSIPEISELTPVPGNRGLSEGRKVARVREIFRPYHDRMKQ